MIYHTTSNSNFFLISLKLCSKSRTSILANQNAQKKRNLIFFRFRGALNSLSDPSYNLGIITSFFLGNYLNCLDQAKIQLIMPVIFVIVLFFLPESPEYWITRRKEKVNMACKMQKRVNIFLKISLKF